MDDLKGIESRGENVLILGDMNRAIETGKWGVPDNKTNISFGGQLLRDLLATERYILLNSLSLEAGGSWTWVDRSKSNVKSCLDLGIVSAGLAPFLSKFLVDKEQKLTPMRVRKRSKKILSTYGDHYSVEFVFSGLQRGGRQDQEMDKDNSAWNLKKDGGWEMYIQETVR